MKRTIGMIIMVATCIGLNTTAMAAADKDYPVQPVPFTRVRINDRFWAPRLETNRKVSIPYAFRKCEETGRIDNFAVAGGLMEGKTRGLYFNDSDVYKVIEGAAYSLSVFPDAELEKYVDDVIAKIAGAQEDDGYLYTARTGMTPDRMPPGGKERWSDIGGGCLLSGDGQAKPARRVNQERESHLRRVWSRQKVQSAGASGN